MKTQQKELTLKERLNPEMRLRLYKESLRTLNILMEEQTPIFKQKKRVSIPMLLRGAMKNNLFASLDCVMATSPVIMLNFFPEVKGLFKTNSAEEIIEQKVWEEIVLKEDFYYLNKRDHLKTAILLTEKQ